MKNIFYIMLCGLFLTACQENEMKDFDSNGAVYFQLNSSWSNTIDSIVYSFAGKGVDKDTVKLQVNLMGAVADYNRTVRVVIDKERTTAKEGTHYDALNSAYTLPKGEYKMLIPVVLHGNDSELEERSFQIALKLEESEDLQLGLSKRLSARIIISNYHIQPPYWEDDIEYSFGPYSKVKHEHIMLELKKDFPATADEYNDDWATWDAYGKHMNNYFAEHSILDEYGNLIEPWLEE